jgi:UDP-N-acetyl-2-amino-2-deoxyglucuronate dehydrogenase
MSETTVAIAGAGNAATMHAQAIAGLDDVELVGVSSRTESTAAAFVDEHGGDAFTDNARLLEVTEPDQLHVTTPSGAHREPTLAAIDRGIDVLCEKPLEITTDRIDEMAAAADAAEVRLGGVFQQRFAPVMETVHEAAAAGRIGSLAVANATVPWWRDDAYYAGSWKGTRELDGGGALMNQSIHAIDAIQWLARAAGADDGAGANPVAGVRAYTDTLAHDPAEVEVEDTAVASLRYNSGAVGQLLGATSMYPGSLRRLQLAGRDGTVTVEEDELVTWQFRDEWADDDQTRERFGPGDVSGGAADPMDVDVANHRRNIRAFIEARRAGEPTPLDASEARIAVAIIEAIYESAETGAPVTPVS